MLCTQFTCFLIGQDSCSRSQNLIWILSDCDSPRLSSLTQRWSLRSYRPERKECMSRPGASRSWIKPPPSSGRPSCPAPRPPTPNTQHPQEGSSSSSSARVSVGGWGQKDRERRRRGGGSVGERNNQAFASSSHWFGQSVGDFGLISS